MKTNNKEKLDKQRSLLQNRALHKGCTQIADMLVEHGISLNVAIKNLDVRPTMESIKDAYRAIAKAKYGVDSTADLKTNEISEVWKDLTKTLSQNTGIDFPFPSEKDTDEYIKSYEQLLDGKKSKK